MNYHKPIFRWLAGLLLGLALLLPLSAALAAGGIDPTDKWARGTNAGWINFAPDYGGVTVYSDHLEGYAWGENIGWIRLGTCAGSPCTHANTTAGNYGVNNDGVGNLSGYAWSSNTGWINFAPANGGVWVDPVTGDFSGYAWGENAGWIHLQNTAPAYKVNTGWRGDLLELTYQNGIAAIITSHRTAAGSSNGLSIANASFLNDSGDGIIFGHNNAAFAWVTTNLPAGVETRWARLWQLDVNDGAGTSGGNVTLTFDISEAGGLGNFDIGLFTLLKRATGSSGNFVSVANSYNVSGDQVTFSSLDTSLLWSEFTLGSITPTAVLLETFQAAARPGGILVTWETASEFNLVGFNLYRGEAASGPWTRLNSTLIQAQFPGNLRGGNYAYLDTPTLAGASYYYRLEWKDTNGASILHGPVSISSDGPQPRLYLPLLIFP